MTRGRGRAGTSVLLGLLTLSASESLVGFTSTQFRYHVAYPASWQVHDASLAHLEIYNFPREQRVQGVVIPAHGASVTVTGAPPGVSTVQEWVASARHASDTVVTDRKLQPTRSAPDGCATLRELVREEEAGPNVYYRISQIYCGTSSGAFVIELVNWKGDPDEQKYEAMALDIARSLRSNVGNE